MTNNIIAKFCEVKDMPIESCIKIDFKKRATLYGFIIASSDYDYLKSKNLWRIVTRENFKNWKKTGNLDYAKIFNGSDFTKLSFEKTGMKVQ